MGNERINAKERARLNAIVAVAAKGMPLLQEFLNRVAGEDELRAAVEGIWCGLEGRVNIDFYDRYLVVGWYNGRVEYAYIS